MSHIMYVGGVGTGKTYCAIAAALEDDGDYIVSNQPLRLDLMDKEFGVELPDRDVLTDQQVIDKGSKAVKTYQDFEDDAFKEAKCGVLFIDEAPLFMDARKWDSLSDEARSKIIEHRKDDIDVYSTAQHVSFVDKLFRIMTDEVRLVRKESWPLLGYLWPHSVRPTIWCQCGRMRRDGVGDESAWWKRLLGFGTIYRWRIYSPTILGDEQDIAGTDLPESAELGSGRRLFDIRLARIYDTGHKLSGVARNRKKRNTNFYSAKERRKPDPQMMLISKQACDHKEPEQIGAIASKKRDMTKPPF